MSGVVCDGCKVCLPTGCIRHEPASASQPVLREALDVERLADWLEGQVLGERLSVYTSAQEFRVAAAEFAALAHPTSSPEPCPKCGSHYPDATRHEPWCPTSSPEPTILGWHDGSATSVCPNCGKPFGRMMTLREFTDHVAAHPTTSPEPGLPPGDPDIAGELLGDK